MRLISYSMVRNEEDIIELFIRKNLEVLDHMYISDNMSTDNTRNILNELISEGLPLTVWDDLEPKYIQSEKTTSAYKKIAEQDEFDAIFFIDSDEFLVGDTSNIKDYLKPGEVYALERVNYVINNLELPSMICFDNMQYKSKKQVSSKSMIFHNPNNYKNIVIGQGNHYIHLNKITRDSVLNKNNNILPDIKIAHFPIRSKEHFIRKNLLGWLAYLEIDIKLNTQDNPLGGHWRHAYRFIMSKKCDLSEKDFYRYLYGVNSFEEIKENLIYDPIETDIKLKYTKIMSEKETLNLLVNAYVSSIENNSKKFKEG